MRLTPTRTAASSPGTDSEPGTQCRLQFLGRPRLFPARASPAPKTFEDRCSDSLCPEAKARRPLHLQVLRKCMSSGGAPVCRVSPTPTKCTADLNPPLAGPRSCSGRRRASLMTTWSLPRSLPISHVFCFLCLTELHSLSKPYGCARGWTSAWQSPRANVGVGGFRVRQAGAL